MSSKNKEDISVDKQKRKGHRVTGFEEWGGYMEAKKMKLEAQFAGQRDKELVDQGEIQTDIFKGISIFVNGYTKPSADELKRLMLIHGGTYHHYYSSKTTYIIASNLPYSKIKNLKTQVVLTPNWITDSITASKLLPYQDYFLYTPEVLHNQQRLKFQTPELKIVDDEASNHKNCAKSNDFTSFQDASEKNKVSSKLVHNTNIFQNKITNDLQSSSDSRQSKNLLNDNSSKSEQPLTAGHPGFLSEFYSHSRLHHISTSGQELKQYVQNLVNNHNSKTFTGRQSLKNLVKNGSLHHIVQNKHPVVIHDGEKSQRIIMHLDMDCFFVSVGLRKYPELKGKPVAVTHSRGKRGGAQEGSDPQFEVTYYANQSKMKLEGLTSVESNISDEEHIGEKEEVEGKQKVSKYTKDYGSLSEIASCSYEARKTGIRNGMFLGEALRRCPNLKTIPYDFEGYSEVSKQLYDIVISYTLDIEAVSCDELYIDCTELLHDTGLLPLQFATVLRAEIEEKTKCTASAGLGANMLLARLANRVAKPNGQSYISSDEIENFMLNQKVKDLPGVGYSTSIKFENMGVITCGDLQKWSLSKLQQEFGTKTGQTLFKRCRGKDNRVVQLQKERKSVSAEINYGIRFEKEEEVFKFLKELAVEVVNRLRNIKCKGKAVTLKLMVKHPDAPIQTAKYMGHGVCNHIVKTISFKSATDDPVLIGHECCTLSKSLKIRPEDYRGIGIQLSKLEPVNKDTKGCKSIIDFTSSSAGSSKHENYAEKDISVPKETINKSVPKPSSIKDFLSDKPSVIKKLVAPPVEQLDQSVLNALPEDIQKEVLEMYSSKSSNKSTSSLQHSSASVHPTISAYKPNADAVKKCVPVHQTKNKMHIEENTLLNCIVSAKNHSVDDQETMFKGKATIGGAENINEVRNLVKEWVLSSQVVLEEDIDQFRDYLLQVIDEDLKKVDLILKYFHRVVSTANTLWQQAYLTILSYVQQKMLQKYGTMLEAKNEFST